MGGGGGGGGVGSSVKKLFRCDVLRTGGKKIGKIHGKSARRSMDRRGGGGGWL